MKQMMATSMWPEPATYILEPNKEKVWKGVRKAEKWISK